MLRLSSHATKPVDGADVRRPMSTKQPRQPPWKRPNPHLRTPHSRLTEAEKTAARKRAEEAGRRYPNLVDNMWAMRQRRRKAA
jgi:hypothetical protein